MKDKTWELDSDDKLTDRARKIAEISLADIFDNNTKVVSILPRAILRVQDVLEKVQRFG